MLRQHTSNTFVQVSLVLALSLCSLSAFSEGVRFIKFLRKTGLDKDTYTVRARWGRQYECIKGISPRSFKAVAGDEKGQTVKITYLQTILGCGVRLSVQMFEVQSKQHPGIYAYVRWIKRAGQSPVAQIGDHYSDDHMDPYGITKIDNSNPDFIKVWIGFSGEFQ